MPRIIHPLAGLVAILTIASFWLSTAISELFGSEAAVIAVKTAIPWGFILLVPALAATGGSGFFLSKGQRQGLVGTKLKRMPFIGANGLLVLIPAALFLASKAKAGEFDATFYTVQALELIAGAINIALLGLSMRDGMALTQWRRKSFLRPAATFASQLTGKQEIAKGTWALRLSKPEGFRFVAGQAVYVSLPGLEKPDASGQVRTFSIASAPGDGELEIAIRLTDTSFKRYLTSADIGAAVQVEGPYGDLALHADAHRPAVLLAGGIGVTPFRSMVLDAVNRALPHRLFLFYSNRKPEDAALIDELRELEKENQQFTLIPTFTEGEAVQQGNAVEHGYITAEMIAKHVGDLAAPIFYVAGPPAMVSAMEGVLKSAGVDQRNVHAEKFAGY
jgi:ferredoxin-NADP reductase